MSLNKLLELNKGSVISIIGAGGKTTLMYLLGKELKVENKVLITTTTKIYKPTSKEVDFLTIGSEGFDVIKSSSIKGIYGYGSFVNEDNKLIGVNPELLEKEFSYFDYIIIEADGSNRKSIKGWKDSEPVICNKTNKTIGIVSIDILGKEVNENNIHRVNEFNIIAKAKVGDIINVENIINIVFHKDGLFKKSKGENILFINKIDTYEDYRDSLALLESIKENNKNSKIIDKIIYGSLKNRIYKEIKSGKCNNNGLRGK